MKVFVFVATNTCKVTTITVIKSTIFYNIKICKLDFASVNDVITFK